MGNNRKAHLIEGGTGSLAAAAFMIRDRLCERLGITRKVPPIAPHGKSFQNQFETLVKAFAS